MTQSRSIPRIALIHSAQIAMDPVEQAFTAYWPEVERINLVDDALDVGPTGVAQLPTLERFRDLTDYALATCVQGILYTCSALGDLIDAVRVQWPIPILKANEAMFMKALEYGPRLGLVATLEPVVVPITREFFALADDAAADVTLETVCIPEALGALEANDIVRLEAILAARISGLGECDAIMLADVPTGRAAQAVRRATNRPVLTAPGSAVQLLKRLVSGH